MVRPMTAWRHRAPQDTISSDIFWAPLRPRQQLTMLWFNAKLSLVYSSSILMHLTLRRATCHVSTIATGRYKPPQNTIQYVAVSSCGSDRCPAALMWPSWLQLRELNYEQIGSVQKPKRRRKTAKIDERRRNMLDYVVILKNLSKSVNKIHA